MVKEPRGINWCITLYKDNQEVMGMVDSGEAYYVVKGHEFGERTHREHWHVYIELKERMTCSQLQRRIGDRTAHCELRRKSQKQADEYCKKSKDFVTAGELKANEQGRRSDLEDVRNMLKEGADLIEVAEKHFGDFVRYHRGISLYADLLARKRQKEREPESPEVILYLGEAGSGKSHMCYHDPDFRRDGYRFMVQGENKAYFDGYDGQSVIWFDEFRGSVLPFGLFLQITDKWGPRVEVKGSSVEVFARKILISTVEWPVTWWKGSKKFTADPNQLYRRITKFYYCRYPEEPFELDRRGIDCENFEEYLTRKHYWPVEEE